MKRWSAILRSKPLRTTFSTLFKIPCPHPTTWMLIRQQRGITSKPLPEILRKKWFRIASLTHSLRGLSRVITLTEALRASLPNSAVRKQAQGLRVTHPRSPAPLWQRWRGSYVGQSVLGHHRCRRGCRVTSTDHWSRVLFLVVSQTRA